MLFGREQDFAIEAMVEPGLVPPSSVWGRMRIWCQGRAMGDYSAQHCGLPAGHLEELASALPNPWHSDFDGKGCVEIFRHLDRAIYGCQDGVELAAESFSSPNNFDRNRMDDFVFLTNWEEMFDRDDKAFIVCPDGVSVNIIVQHLSPVRYSVMTTSVKSIQVACGAFSNWYKDQISRLSFVST